MGKRNWTREEDDYIRGHYGPQSMGQLAARFGVTRSAIAGKCDRLGLTEKGSPGRPKLAVEGVPRYKHRMGPVRSLPPRQCDNNLEPPMPQVNDAQKLHSRAYKDLELGMCNWPVYFEQGTQMYCAAATERLPGRYDVYCECHREMSQQPRAERRAKYKQGVWAR